MRIRKQFQRHFFPAASVCWLFHAASSFAADLPRSWQGVYAVNTDPVILSLDIDTSDTGEISGTVRFETKKKDKRFDFYSGSYHVRGQFDASTGILRLSPAEWIDGTGRNYHFGFSFLGFHDAATQGMGGVMYSGRRTPVGNHFALLPTSKAKNLVKRAPPFSTQPAGMGLSSCGKFERWLALAATEYPAVEAKWRTALPMAYNLFEDGHFKSVFKKPFDELSVMGRGGIVKGMQRCSGRSAELRPLANLMQAFLGQAARTYAVVAANRTIRAWHQGFEAHMTSQPASVALFQRALGTQQDILFVTETLFPREQQAFAGAVDRTLVTIADAALQSSSQGILAATVEQTDAKALTGWFGGNEPMIDKSSDGVKEQVVRPMRKRVDDVLTLHASRAVDAASGYDGAATLSGWSRENAALLQLASSSARSETVSRVDQRYDVLLEQSLASEPAPFDESMNAFDAIRSGNTWYQRLMNRYRFASEEAPFLAVMQGFRARRADQIAAASQPIVLGMLEFSREGDVDRYIAETLPVPGDLASPAGRMIADAAVTYNYDLRRARILGPDAIADHVKALSVPAEDRAPTAVDMYDALTRSMNGINKVVGSARGTCNVASEHVLTQLAGCYLEYSDASVGELRARITRLRRFGCKKDVGTYVCEYHLGMQVYDRSTRQNNAYANDPTRPILDGIFDLAEAGERVYGRFVYDGDWIYYKY